MPFKSKAQLRACFARKDPKWDCHKWAHETPNLKNLPDKKKKKKKNTKKSFREWLEAREEKIGIDALPDHCFAILPNTGELVRITKGQSGYRPYRHDITDMSVTAMGGKKGQELADDLNAELGVSQRAAEVMLAGSMFGWHIPIVRNYKSGHPEV